MLLKKDIAQFEIDNGRKPSFNEKEALLQNILADKVFVAGKGRFRPMPIYAVDLKDQKKVYVKVGGKRIFMKDIPEKQEEYIIKSIYKSRVTCNTTKNCRVLGRIRNAKN